MPSVLVRKADVGVGPWNCFINWMMQMRFLTTLCLGRNGSFFGGLVINGLFEMG